MQRRDAAIREERKLQDKLASMIQAKESELERVQQEKNAMTIRIFARRWRNHGLYKVLSAWKRYTVSSKLGRRTRAVAQAQKELASLEEQLAASQEVVTGNYSASQKAVRVCLQCPVYDCMVAAGGGVVCVVVLWCCLAPPSHHACVRSNNRWHGLKWLRLPR